MATLMQHVLLQKFQQLNLKSSFFFVITRGTVIPARKKPVRGTIKHRNLIKATGDSLAARGFLRSQKPYTPPEDVTTKLQTLIQSIYGSKVDKNQSLGDLKVKFNLLNACFCEFKHSVPNSLLHKIETIGDVLEYYKTPVTTTTPLDEFRSKELPPNLHIQYDYVRFHPEEDTMFGGVTAFPYSSTIVTGLRAKEKYKGHSQKLPNYYDNWSTYRED